jgi:hypothetical protein
VAQVVGQVLRRGVPVRGALRQGLEADALQLPRQGVVDLPRRPRLGGGDQLQQFVPGVGPERRPPGEQLVEDDAEAVDVGTAVHAVALAAGLLRAHVGWRAGIAGALAHVLFPQGQAEVGHVRPAGRVQQDVAGLDVAVDDALAVGVVQRLGDRGCQFRGHGRRGPVVADQPGEGAALDEPGHDEAGIFGGAAGVVDGDDVRVVEPGGGAGLGEVDVGVLGAADQPAVRHLDGHAALELVVVGQVDAAEPAFTQQPLDAITADLGRGVAGGSRAVLADRLFLLLGGGPERVSRRAHGGLGAGPTVELETG